MFNIPQALSACADTINRLLETKLPAISGEPTYHTIKAIEEKLVSALGGIHTEQGGGNMGFIGLLFSDAEYVTLEDPQGNNPPVFISAVHPGTLTIPTGTNIYVQENMLYSGPNNQLKHLTDLGIQLHTYIIQYK